MHVIPVEKAIDALSTSVPIEHIEHWLDKYEGKYAASTCSCRASRRVMGEGCADDPADWCIAVGDMADYVVETDRGHYVTREEVYDILRQAEDNGFVHRDHQYRRREQDSRSATATSTCATPCAPRSCSTRPTCRARPMSPRSRRTSAWPAVAALRCALPVPPSSARSSAAKRPADRCPSIRARSCPMPPSGTTPSGRPTTATITVSRRTSPAPRPARRLAPRTLPFRAI